MVAVPPPAARQETFQVSYGQPCAFCQRHSSHAYFESMDPDTDTDSDLTEQDDEDEDYLNIIHNNDRSD
eukprot:2335598-Prorocentrum_lima.AAC.1